MSDHQAYATEIPPSVVEFFALSDSYLDDDDTHRSVRRLEGSDSDRLPPQYDCFMRIIRR